MDWEPGAEEDARIAIVGVGARLPGAADLDGLWRLLVAGETAARRFSRAEMLEDGVPEEVVDDSDYVPVRAVIDDGRGATGDPEAAKAFDAAFFHMSPGEAARTDPQHRLFLECAHRALEDGGLDPARFDGLAGVWGGCSSPTYLLNNLRGHQQVPGSLGAMPLVLGNDQDHLATRVAWKLGLEGPAISLGTACSTSLVALHLACQALLDHQCDAALAGGASVVVPTRAGHLYRPGHIFSREGECRAFDSRADGIFSGDGAAVVLLLRLPDALERGLPIRALITGSAVNNDGRRKVGYSAPSVDAQAECIATAQAVAGIEEASRIGYVEAHGTGTPLGDPVEVAALTRAFRETTAAVGSTALGSLKPNLGHLNAASGIAGLVKATLALERGAIPPLRGFESPHPELALDTSPFHIPSEPLPWTRGEEPRVAAVSSLGAGGTNAHVILEEAPLPAAREPSTGPWWLPLQGPTRASLPRLAADLARTLDGHDPGDVAWTLATGRAPRAFRRAVVIRQRAAAAAALRADGPLHQVDPDHVRPVVFAFPGQGFQRAGMAAGLCAGSTAFQLLVERVAQQTLDTLGVDPRPLLRGEAVPDPDDQRLAGPALFTLELGLARLLEAEGLLPDAVLGHSTGEYVAAVVAGLLDEEAALGLFLERARLLHTLREEGRGGGALLVLAAPDEVAPHLDERAWISLVNEPGATVISAADEALEPLDARLSSAGLATRRIRVSVPPHCPLLEPLADPLREAAASLRPQVPALPFASGLTGGVLTDAEATDLEHWPRHLVEPNRFDRAASALAASQPLVLPLSPPGPFASVLRAAMPGAAIVEGHAPEAPDVLELLGGCWARGGPLAPGPRGERRSISLPPTPLEPVRCWVDAPGSAAWSGGTAPERAPALPRPLDEAWIAPRTETERVLARSAAALLGLERVGATDDLVALGADSLLLLKLVDEVRTALGRELPPGAAFAGLTVAELARGLGDGAARTETEAPEPQAPSLVPLRRRGERLPFFCVHPAAGPVFPYFELARRLGPDQPFWALQAHGLDGRTEPHTTVEQMGAAYVEAVREVQPHGPYRLGGYSFGGLVAWEMALRLEDQGEEVGLLAILDEPAPVAGHRPGPTMVASLFATSFVKSFLPHLQDYLYLAMGQAALGRGHLLGRLARAPRAALRLLERSAMASIVPPESSLMALQQPAMTPMARLFLIHVLETFRYAPLSRDGGLTLFRSGSYDRFDPHPNLGWDKLARGPIEVVPVPGDHLSTIRAPHVEVLARELSLRLA